MIGNNDKEPTLLASSVRAPGVPGLGMPPKRGLSLVCLALLLSVAPRPAEGGVAVGGHDRARILPPTGARISDYQNFGYRLLRQGQEVFVEVDTSPLGSKASFQPPRRWPDDPVARLARAQTSGAGTRFEAVSRLLAWVSRHIEYRLDRREPQDAVSVLERRSAYCTGIARLTVALVRAAGIEAREVAGYVADDGSGDRIRGYHRWVEVYFPDRGWVFSDPMASHHYVPATYVRLASDDLWIDDGLEGLLLDRSGRIVVLDLEPRTGAGITSRRNSARRLAASLEISVEGAGTAGEVVLISPSRLYLRPLVDGGTTFVGLEPGAYQVDLRIPGREIIRHKIELPDRLAAALRVKLGTHHGNLER